MPKKVGSVVTRKIGSVAVDTGQIVILDPCRAEELDDWKPTDFGKKQLSEFVVSAPTGMGDGRYPVFADVLLLPDGDESLVGIYIDFNSLYCFADDPKFAKKIKQHEAKILA